ncbi:MAG: hypothetical protein B6D39_08535, partial [Anaerolineae bacterium UTCFX2]
MCPPRCKKPSSRPPAWFRAGTGANAPSCFSSWRGSSPRCVSWRRGKAAIRIMSAACVRRMSACQIWKCWVLSISST